MSFHLRFTPYELSSENLTSFCNKWDKFIIAREQHSKNGEKCELHYHIYIEDDYNIDTIRNVFLKSLGIPKAGSGRNNKYYMLKAWNDKIDYIIKQGDIIAQKGWDMEVLRMLAERARVPPDPVEEKENKKIQATAGPAPPKEKKEIGMWNQILEEAQFMKHRKKIEIDLEEALKIISRIYIKKMLPLPHPGDRKRWATSLVMYSKMGFDVESDPTLREKLIEEEALQFIGENMVKPITNG